jgi:hypothetical protein
MARSGRTKRGALVLTWVLVFASAVTTACAPETAPPPPSPRTPFLSGLAAEARPTADAGVAPTTPANPAP